MVIPDVVLDSFGRSLRGGAKPFLVVVSEGGGIDSIPNLRHAVRRSGIDNARAELEALESIKPISRTRYHAALDFLDRHRFYLRKEDCDFLNPIVGGLEEALRERDKPQLWVAREEFVSNSDLDEGLYYEKEYGAHQLAAKVLCAC